jgi:site-specific recombinase XerC
VTKKAFPPLPVGQWPDLDQSLWHVARQPAGPFDDDAGFAAQWRPATIRGCERGYGVWLGWLATKGQLDPDVHPCERVTKDRIKAFLLEYRIGRAELTVAATIRNLAYVLRGCSPPHGVAWLTKLAHRMVNTGELSRPKLPRMARVTDVDHLAERLMHTGLQQLRKGQRTGAVAYRDGLMIGLLINRAMRLRNLASLRIGHNIIIADFGMRMIFPPEETKKGVPLDWSVPERLEPAVLTYIGEVRPALLKQGIDDQGWFWIGRRGRRMPDTNISIRVTKTTRKHLGRDMSPHLFRDCVVTEVALERPEWIGISKNLLGHKLQASSQKYYNQATSFTAFARYGDVIRKLREE